MEEFCVSCEVDLTISKIVTLGAYPNSKFSLRQCWPIVQGSTVVSRVILENASGYKPYISAAVQQLLSLHVRKALQFDQALQ